MEKARHTQRIAITDLETTGIDPMIHEIVEIGLLLIDQNTFQIVDRLEVKVMPEHLGTASEAALILNGYSNEVWKDALTLREAMSLYVAKTSGAMLCAHNITFDWSFLSEAFRRTGVQSNMDYHRLDLFTMAWVLLREYDIEEFNLNKICAVLGAREEPAPHRAINGALTAYEVFKKLVTLNLGARMADFSPHGTHLQSR